MSGPDGQISATLGIGDDFESFEPEIELSGGEVTQVEFQFQEGNINPNDWFVLTVVLETGETGLYFIDL